jgi:hypothetical protein
MHIKWRELLLRELEVFLRPSARLPRFLTSPSYPSYPDGLPRLLARQQRPLRRAGVCPTPVAGLAAC